MRVRLRFFASFRDQMGSPERWVDLEEGTNLRDLTSSMGQHHPFLVSGLVAINGRYLDAGTIIRDGDEVAFFPPVSGG